MSDTYQAVYDAARSRLSNCDVGSAVESAVSSQFGSASIYLEQLREAYLIAANEMQRPSVLYRPMLTQSGGRWYAKYPGGFRGEGSSPEEAMANFDIAWRKKL